MPQRAATIESLPMAFKVVKQRQADPHAGDLFIFRGRKGDRVTLCTPVIKFPAVEEC